MSINQRNNTCSNEESQIAAKEPGKQDTEFWRAYHSFWSCKRTSQVEEPKFYGQPLDLEVLFQTVKDLGGYEQVSIERKWAQVARIICPIKNTSNGSFMIKRIYERMLLELENEFKQSNRKRTCQEDIPGHISKRKNNRFDQENNLAAQRNTQMQVQAPQLPLFVENLHQKTYMRNTVLQRAHMKRQREEDRQNILSTMAAEQFSNQKDSPLLELLTKINENIQQENRTAQDDQQSSSQNYQLMEDICDGLQNQPCTFLQQLLYKRIQNFENKKMYLEDQVTRLKQQVSDLEKRFQIMQETEETHLNIISQFLQYNQQIIESFL